MRATRDLRQLTGLEVSFTVEHGARWAVLASTLPPEDAAQLPASLTDDGQGLRTGVLEMRSGEQLIRLVPLDAGQDGRIVAVLEQPILYQEQPLDVGASIGIALFPRHAEDSQTLVRNADIAMYVAKRTRSGYSLYDSSCDTSQQEHLSLLSELPDRIAALLAEHRVPPDMLCLEITESGFMEDPQHVQKVLDRLAALGVQLSIDDYGTGYSSLSYIMRSHCYASSVATPPRAIT